MAFKSILSAASVGEPAKATWSSASSGGPTRCRARTARLVNGTCAATASTPSAASRKSTGFMSERWRIEPEYTMKVDPSLGLLGVLLEPTTVVTKAWEQVQAISRRAYWEGRKVLVTGAGPIGLLAALVGQQHGFEVHVLDRVKAGAKPDQVRALGATYHDGGVADIGVQPDVIVECTAVGQVIADSVNVAAAGGMVCLTGSARVAGPSASPPPTPRRRWCSKTTSSSEALTRTSGIGTRPVRSSLARMRRGWRACSHGVRSRKRS